MKRSWQRFKAPICSTVSNGIRWPWSVLSSLLYWSRSAFSAPLIAPYDPYDTATIDIMDSEIPPSWMGGGGRVFPGHRHPGRDLFSTMLYGLRTSVIIGVRCGALSGHFGNSVGLTAGYVGGRIDAFLMRVADIQFSIPYLIVAIITSAIFQMAFGVGNLKSWLMPLLIIIIGIVRMAQICPHGTCIGPG